MPSEFFDQIRRDRDFALLPAFRVEAKIGLGGYSNRAQPEVHITPEKVHDLLFPKAGQQER